MSVTAYKKNCDCGSYFVWRSGTIDYDNIKHTWIDCYSIEKGLSS